MQAQRMIGLTLLFILALVSQARADMCLGGANRPKPPRPTPTEKKDGEEPKDSTQKQASLGAGLALCAAFVGSGLYFMRRRERFLWPCVLLAILGGLALVLGSVTARAMEANHDLCSPGSR